MCINVLSRLSAGVPFAALLTPRAADARPPVRPRGHVKAPRPPATPGHTAIPWHHSSSAPACGVAVLL